MKRSLVLVLSLSLMVALTLSLAAQAGLSGRWSGETEGGRMVQLDVKAVRNQLTGTLTIDKKPATISDGSITKDTFSFKAPMGGKPVAFSGKVAGDEIELKHEGAKRAVVLTRVKS